MRQAVERSGPRPMLALSAQRVRRLSWLGAGLLVGLLAALGMLIRSPQEPAMTAVEGFYTPNVQYGPWFLANTERLFAQTGELPVRSNYTAGLRYGATDYVHTYLTGAALILSGERDVERIGWLYAASPWQGLILVPLAIFALYGLYCRLTKLSMRPMHLIILYALASLPNYQMVNWALSGGYSLPLGWFIVYCTYMALLARLHEEQHAWRWMLLLIACLLILQPTYHTAALTVVILISSIWALQRLLGMRAINTSLLLLSGVIFASFLMYHAVLLFQDYGRIFVRFLNDMYRSDDHERLRYMMTGSAIDVRLQLLSYVAMSLPPAWLAVEVLRGWRRKAAVTDGRYELLWLLGLMPMTVLLYAWDGLLGVFARVLQYGTLLAIACSVVLLLRHRRATPVLAVAAAICVAVTSYSMVTARISTQITLTRDELEAASWISATHGCERPIFTDFRIGTTMGYQGCFAVVGPTAGSLSARNQIERLADLLYAADPPRLSAALDGLSTLDGEPVTTILLSRRFLNERIGFVVPDMRLQPMSEAQWATYRGLAGWRIVFENETTLVLARDNGKES